jgi:thioredoxin-like negative regulator of GroEL
MKANIDNYQSAAEALNVKSTPALFLFQKGKVLDVITSEDVQRLDDMFKTAQMLEDNLIELSPVIELIAQAIDYIEFEVYMKAEECLQQAWAFEQYRK